MPARTRTGWPAVLVVVLAAVCVLSACSGAAAGARPSPWWAGVQTPGAAQAGAFRGMPGSSAYRCVRVGHHRDVRSGGFLAGNFGFDEQGFAAAYQQTRRHTAVKRAYWIPLHVDHMSELTVQATLLPGRTVTGTSRQSQAATGGGVVFYRSAVPIPVPGTWKLAAGAGANRGCFIVTFPAPAR